MLWLAVALPLALLALLPGRRWVSLWQRELRTEQTLSQLACQVKEEADAVFALSSEALRDLLWNQGYVLEGVNLERLRLYLRQGKPVGLRGEPGIGKSQLPEVLAEGLGYAFIDLECHSQLESDEIGISWNGFKQIVDAQTGRATGDLYTLDYLNTTPLLESLLAKQPTVVRVDEVDKLNEHTTNFFLRYLDKKELVIHNLAGGSRRQRAEAPLLIFLTSNDYKRLDPAFMRRVVWLDLTFPTEGVLAQILVRQTGVPVDYAARLARMVHQIRQLNLEKRPSIGEAIDWCRALLDLGGGELTQRTLDITLGFLIKYSEDEPVVREALSRWYPGFYRVQGQTG